MGQLFDNIVPTLVIKSRSPTLYQHLTDRHGRQSVMISAWEILKFFPECLHYYLGNNTPSRNLDLLAKLKAVTNSKSFTPTYAGFHWGKKNGEHKAIFNMSLNIIGITDGNPVSNEPIATWTAGIDSPLMVSFSDKLYAYILFETCIARTPIDLLDVERHLHLLICSFPFDPV